LITMTPRADFSVSKLVESDCPTSRPIAKNVC
jgi:hypothetical protein